MHSMNYMVSTLIRMNTRICTISQEKRYIEMSRYIDSEVENMDYKEFYDTNPDFHRYIDRYRAHYNEGRPISLKEALTHKLVQEVAHQFRECGGST